jgi:hypothetical protein
MIGLACILLRETLHHLPIRVGLASAILLLTILLEVAEAWKVEGCVASFGRPIPMGGNSCRLVYRSPPFVPISW